MIVRLIGPILVRAETPRAIICVQRCQLQRYNIGNNKVVGFGGVESIQSSKIVINVVRECLPRHLAVLEQAVYP